MKQGNRIAPCLWFDNQAEDAAKFYTSIFPNSKVGKVARYGDAGHEIHGRPRGSVLTVAFELDGQPFTALNGGPEFRFNEAVSFQIQCESQQEIDRYWQKLTPGGDEAAQVCGWLEDRFGLSWQVVPRRLEEMMRDPDTEKASRVMEAMLQMKKIDLAKLEQAYVGAHEHEAVESGSRESGSRR